MDESSSSSTNSESLEGREIKDTPYRLIGKNSLAGGSFCQVYLTRNLKTGELVATKLVKKDNPHANLKKEYEWYRILGCMTGLPEIYHFGECGPYNAMVMELLGPNLEQVFTSRDCKFSIRTTTQIAIKILEIIRYVHSKKIIFCNVKPENFCLGRPNSSQANQVFMIGLINAKSFETDENEHIPKFQTTDNRTMGKKQTTGTPRYMSINAHKGKELSRRDDLESIGYMLLYFLKGKLPWQGLVITGNENKHDSIYIKKKTIELEELCADLPPEYYHYMLYVRSLKFAHEPNYRYLINMFTRLLFRITMDNNDLNDTSGIQKFNNNNNKETEIGTNGTFKKNVPVSLSSNTTTNNNNNNNQQSRKSVSFKMDHHETDDHSIGGDDDHQSID